MTHFTRHKLIEGGIAADSAFFGVLVGLTFANVLPEGLWAAGIAAGVAFFASLGGNGVADRETASTNE